MAAMVGGSSGFATAGWAAGMEDCDTAGTWAGDFAMPILRTTSAARAASRRLSSSATVSLAMCLCALWDALTCGFGFAWACAAGAASGDWARAGCAWNAKANGATSANAAAAHRRLDHQGLFVPVVLIASRSEFG
jgi:hypothetical protein